MCSRILVPQHAAGHHHGEGLLCRWKLNGRPTFDFQAMQRNKRRELERLSDIYRKNLEKAEVDFIEGRGRLLDRNTVEVNGLQYKVSHTSHVITPITSHRSH